jgi:hypothetical protein
VPSSFRNIRLLEKNEEGRPNCLNRNTIYGSRKGTLIFFTGTWLLDMTYFFKECRIDALGTAIFDKMLPAKKEGCILKSTLHMYICNTVPSGREAALLQKGAVY